MSSQTRNVTVVQGNEDFGTRGRTDTGDRVRVFEDGTTWNQTQGRRCTTEEVEQVRRNGNTTNTTGRWENGRWVRS